jgi:hypothetical protein
MSIEENVPSRRALSYLAKLQGLHGVPEDSLRAMLNMCNPFPDDVSQRVGFPDGQPVPTLVVEDTYETNIACPASITTGTWDAHIALLPKASVGPVVQKQTSPYISGGNVVNGTGTSGYTAILAPLTIMAAQSGTAMYPHLRSITGTSGATDYSIGSYDTGALIASYGGSFRKIGEGVELINQSAMLYRGGTAYSYRLKPGVRNNAYVSASTFTAGNVVPSGNTVLDSPPGTVADIVNLGTTHASDASDGAYAINLPRNIDEMGFRAPNGGYMLFEFPADSNEAITAQKSYALDWDVDTGYCYAGVFLTGLSLQSAFRLRYRTYWEFLPGVGVQSLSMMRISTPGPEYNPVVHEALRLVIRHMPAGCRYVDNPLGEWFDSLLSIVEAAAPAVGAAISPFFGPAGMIGNAIGGVASHIKKNRVTPAVVGTAPSSATSSSPDAESGYSKPIVVRDTTAAQAARQSNALNQALRAEIKALRSQVPRKKPPVPPRPKKKK